jgi:acyl carrier protein
MENEVIVGKLTNIFRTVFMDEGLVLTDSMSANDVDRWDSLTHMLMVTAVEKEFGIKFKLKDLNKMKNVGDLIQTIQSKLEQQ